MLKPARMTRLVLGGHRSHLEAVLDALHKEGLVHLEDYADPTGTTTIGTPLEAGDAASALLLRVRGLLKGLGAESPQPTAAAGPPAQTVEGAEKAILPVLEAATAQRTVLAQVEAERAALEPLAALDIELSAVDGLRSLRGFLGGVRADPTPALRRAGVDASVEMARTPDGGLVAAVFVPRAKADATERALAEWGFAAIALPRTQGTPRARLAEVANSVSAASARLAELDAQVARLRAEWAGRLAAAERQVADEVEVTQAPLRLRVTDTTFHAEGWVPQRQAARIQATLDKRVGSAIYVEDLGDAPRTGERAGGAHGDLEIHSGPGEAHGEADAHSHDHHADPSDEAPVKLENPNTARPFEFLLGLLGRPRYKEIDPTTLMLVFFPLFFGLMVGDVVVGIAIVFLGLWLKKNHVFGIGGPAVGRVLVMGGVMATLVGGVVFGEALGIHFVVDQHAIDEGEPSWECILGFSVPKEGFLHVHRKAPIDCEGSAHADASSGLVTDAAHAQPRLDSGHLEAAGAPLSPPVEDVFVTHAEEAKKEEPMVSLAPHSKEHLSVNGWFNLGYYSKIHDIKALLIWSVIIGIVHIVLGFILGVRNVNVAHGPVLALQEKGSWLILLACAPLAVYGAAGGPAWALWGGLLGLVAAIVLLWIGTAKVLGVGFVALLETLGFVGNLLSYTRIAAIGASKAGMAVAFMAIGFDVVGGGSFHSVAGWIIYIFGMVVITLLAVLSGGLQSLRLQFVEFFQKFFTGGGRPYVPFGRRAP